MRLIVQLFLYLAFFVPALQAQSSETWRGLTVAPEYRCSPYRSDDYRYPQSVEPQIVATMDGRIYGPYTGRDFESIRQTDIEHIVARSEAHDSGLCAADATTRRRFAADPDNLTLASPSVNRGQKKAKDAADWLPAKNECWFAGRVVEVKREYGLTVPRESAEAMVWYRRAAEQGNAAAQYQLGVIYFFGEGVRPDRVSAYMWFHLAGANGYAAGVPWRDRVARDMSPEQITAAQRLAREWVEAHRAGGK